MTSILHTALIDGLVVNSLLVVPLAAVAWLVGRWANRPAVAHALWVLVLLKLMTPPLVDLPVIPVAFAPAALVEPLIETASLPERDAADLIVSVTPAAAPLTCPAPQPRDVPSRDPQPREPHAGPLQPRELPAVAVSDRAAPVAALAVPAVAVPAECGPLPAAVAPPAGFGVPQEIPSILLALWLCGSLAMAGVQVVRAVRFRRFLRLAQPSAALFAETAQLAASMGLNRVPAVRTLPGVVSPMLLGCGPWAVLLFPARLAERLSPARRAPLLAHELAHYGRGDGWIRLLELAASTLFWWHPAVWLARGGLEAAGEDCADAWVVERFRTAPRTYASALLDAVDFLAAGPSAVVPGATGLGTAASLRRRLTRIMRGTGPRTLSTSGRAAVLLLCIALPMQPALQELAAATTQAAADFLPAPLPNITPLPEPIESAAVMAAGERPTVRLPEPLAPLPDAHIWATATSRDGRFSLDVPLAGVAILRDAATGRSVPLVDAAGSATVPRAADFSADGRLLAVADAAGVRLWDVEQGRMLARLTAAGPDLRGVAFAADNRLAVTGAAGVTVFDLPAETSQQLPPLEQPAGSVRFSPDGRTLAVVCGAWQEPAAGRVLLWDGTAWMPLKMAEHPAAIAFTGDGRGLSVAGWDGRVSLFDVADGVADGTPRGTAWVEKAQVSAAAFSPAAFSPATGALEGLTFVPPAPPLPLRSPWLSFGFGLAGEPAAVAPPALLAVSELESETSVETSLESGE